MVIEEAVKGTSMFLSRRVLEEEIFCIFNSDLEVFEAPHNSNWRIKPGTNGRCFHRAITHI